MTEVCAPSLSWTLPCRRMQNRRQRQCLVVLGPNAIPIQRQYQTHGNIQVIRQGSKRKIIPHAPQSLPCLLGLGTDARMSQIGTQCVTHAQSGYVNLNMTGTTRPSIPIRVPLGSISSRPTSASVRDNPTNPRFDLTPPACVLVGTRRHDSKKGTNNIRCTDQEE